MPELRSFESWSADRQAQVINWYRACVLKHVYRSERAGAPTGRWLLAKNPAFTQKVPALRRVFPGARFAVLARDPLQAIPSRLNLIRAIWRRRFPGYGEMTARQVRVIFEDSVQTYLSAERELAALDDRDVLVLRYVDLVRDPKGTLTHLYRRFDLGEAPPEEVLAQTGIRKDARPGGRWPEGTSRRLRPDR